MTGLRHQALLYASDEEFVGSLVPFIRDGVDAGEHVLVVTSAEHIALLRAELGPAAGDVRFIEAGDWFHAPVTALAAYDRYLAEHAGNGRVRLIAEAVWTGGAPADQWPRYEAVINVAFAGVAAWIVCPYDLRRAAAELVDSAPYTHPALAVGPGVAANTEYLAPQEYHRLVDSRELRAAPAAAVWSDFGPRDLRDVRSRMAGEAERAGLPPDRVAHLVCAVNEVATNAVQHGGGAGGFRCWIDERAVVCEIASFGAFTAPFPGYLPPRRDTTSGRGLWLARQLCDLVEIRTDAGRSLVRLTMIR